MFNQPNQPFFICCLHTNCTVDIQRGTSRLVTVRRKFITITTEKMSKTHGNKRKSLTGKPFSLCVLLFTARRPNDDRMIVIAWVAGISCVINKIISDRLGKAHKAKKENKKEWSGILWTDRMNESKWNMEYCCSLILFYPFNLHTNEKYTFAFRSFVCVFIFAFIFSARSLVVAFRFEWIMRRVYSEFTSVAF